MVLKTYRSVVLAFGLAATGTAVLFTSPTFAAASQARAIIGNTVHGTEDDGEFYDYYAPNGSVTSQLVDGDTTHGRWTIESGNICLDFPGDTKACYAVV